VAASWSPSTTLKCQLDAVDDGEHEGKLQKGRDDVGIYFSYVFHGPQEPTNPGVSNSLVYQLLFLFGFLKLPALLAMCPWRLAS
jgi:hypothetical protein